jgi:hypothetical protein
MLIAVGAIHHNFRASLISLPISALLLCLASPFGVVALAATQLITVPFQTFVALHFIRMHVHFRWGELTAAVQQSAFVTLCSAAGPIAIVVITGLSFDLTVIEASVAALLAAVGWILGIWLSQHQVLTELRQITDAVGRGTAGPRSRRPEFRLLVRLAGRFRSVSAGDQ